MEKNEGRRIALYEEEIYQKKEVKEDTASLIVFRLASEWYGVHVANVKQVVKFENFTWLPSAPEYIAGIIQLRGNILSITDLKKIFGFPASAPTKQARLVIIYEDHLETALLVDEVTGIVDIPIKKIDPPLATIPADSAEFIEGECRVGRRLFALLNIRTVLHIRDAAQENA